MNTESIHFAANRQIMDFARSFEQFCILSRPLTPDHIVYCKAEPMWIENASENQIRNTLNEFIKKQGYRPKIIFVKGLGMFSVGTTMKEAVIAEMVWIDALKIAVYAQNFGGLSYLSKKLTNFIINWEAETYRQKMFST